MGANLAAGLMGIASLVILILYRIWLIRTRKKEREALLREYGGDDI